jgi:hypothetical protein
MRQKLNARLLTVRGRSGHSRPRLYRRSRRRASRQSRARGTIWHRFPFRQQYGRKSLLDLWRSLLRLGPCITCSSMIPASCNTVSRRLISERNSSAVTSSLKCAGLFGSNRLASWRLSAHADKAQLTPPKRRPACSPDRALTVCARICTHRCILRRQRWVRRQ